MLLLQKMNKKAPSAGIEPATTWLKAKKVDFGRDDDASESEINAKAKHIQKLFKTCEQAITDIDTIFREDLGAEVVLMQI